MKKKTDAQKRLEYFKQLLNYVQVNNIPISIMLPVVGGYKLCVKDVELDRLISLLDYYFRNDKPKDIRFYYVVHDKMMDMFNS